MGIKPENLNLPVISANPFDKLNPVQEISDEEFFKKYAKEHSLKLHDKNKIKWFKYKISKTDLNKHNKNLIKIMEFLLHNFSALNVDSEEIEIDFNIEYLIKIEMVINEPILNTPTSSETELNHPSIPSKFKKGDRVRIITNYSYSMGNDAPTESVNLYGLEGIIINWNSWFLVNINGREFGFNESDLEAVEPEFDYIKAKPEFFNRCDDIQGILLKDKD